MIQDPVVRAALEPVYAALLGALVVLARALGKPCPVETRAEQRARRNHQSML